MNEYFDIEKEDICIERKDSMYDDWRDWFILENKSIDPIHETKIRFYIEDIFIKEILIPIDLKLITTKFKISIKQPICINEVKYVIPEMSFLKRVKFEIPRQVSSGDTCNITTSVSFFE